MQQIGYEEDYYLWIETMVKRLKKRDYARIDWDNLVAEIEDLSRSQKRAVESLLMRLTEHLLKLKYWESARELNQRPWESEVVNFRVLLKKRLKESPSLAAKLADIYQEILPGAKKSVSRLFELPEEIELTLVQILDEDWFPES
ncbi:MAG TPA: DUF29 domain-containing protein [Xenococcaceae cyanobacterium]